MRWEGWAETCGWPGEEWRAVRWENVYVGAAAALLGREEDVLAAVDDGRYDAVERVRDGYRAVRVADGRSSVEMAVSAAGLALERAGQAGGRCEVVVHAEPWGRSGAVARSVQGRTVGARATAFEVRQASNGGLVALHTAASYLAGLPADSAALVTTSDLAPSPAEGCRYRTARGRVLGDGATGVVLTREAGLARLLATTILGDGRDGPLLRADLPWRVVGDGSVEAGGPARRTAENALGELADRLADRERAAVELALAEARIAVEDVAWFVFPNLGRRLQGWGWRERAGIREARTTWEWGRGVGHLGAGDAAAGLTHLLESGAVRPGGKVVLVGGGCGRKVGCAVLEVLEPPHWSSPAA